MIEKIKIAARFAWDVLVPRFITEDVALKHMGDGDPADWASYDIVCAMEDVQPGEMFDGVATVDAFQFLGMGITYRIGNFRPWPRGNQ